MVENEVYWSKITTITKNYLHVSKKSSTFATSKIKEDKMPNAEVANMIPKMQRFFATRPIKRAYLFGSCSRGEETKNSDVDILVDLDKSKPIGLFQYVTMKLDLQDLLHREVDLVESDELLPFAQESANRDKILIYERA